MFFYLWDFEWWQCQVSTIDDLGAVFESLINWLINVWRQKKPRIEESIIFPLNASYSVSLEKGNMLMISQTLEDSPKIVDCRYLALSSFKISQIKRTLSVEWLVIAYNRCNRWTMLDFVNLANPGISLPYYKKSFN